MTEIVSIGSHINSLKKTSSELIAACTDSLQNELKGEWNITFKSITDSDKGYCNFGVLLYRKGDFYKHEKSIIFQISEREVKVIQLGEYTAEHNILQRNINDWLKSYVSIKQPTEAKP